LDFSSKFLRLYGFSLPPAGTASHTPNNRSENFVAEIMKRAVLTDYLGL